MSAKSKGTRNEHRSIKLLEAAGYCCCRSAASLGVWDIVAIGSTDCVLVQVKTRDWPGSVEMEQLKMFPCPPNCRKLVHRWRDRQHVPDVREFVIRPGAESKVRSLEMFANAATQTHRHARRVPVPA